MIQKIQNINDYLGWIDALVSDEFFSTPFCNQERVIATASKEHTILLGSFEGNELTGIFCLLVLEEEKYIETIFLYTREKKAYAELMDYLADRYRGYEIWFVYNPENYVLKSFLSEKKAFFYTEQNFMEYKGFGETDTCEIIRYCDLYRSEYLAIHSRENYWNGEKMLAKLDDFDIFLYIRDDRPVGYIELNKGNNLIEIMDLLVLPEYRNQGIGALLLRKAIFTCSNRRLILTVDIDNAPARHLYEKMGFKEIRSNSSITAKLVVERNSYNKSLF